MFILWHTNQFQKISFIMFFQLKNNKLPEDILYHELLHNYGCKIKCFPVPLQAWLAPRPLSWLVDIIQLYNIIQPEWTREGRKAEPETYNTTMRGYGEDGSWDCNCRVYTQEKLASAECGDIMAVKRDLLSQYHIDGQIWKKMISLYRIRVFLFSFQV